MMMKLKAMKQSGFNKLYSSFYLKILLLLLFNRFVCRCNQGGLRCLKKLLIYLTLKDFPSFCLRKGLSKVCVCKLASTVL